MIARRPSGFIEPCKPSKVARPPSGPLWVHEIKHDGYRLMVRRDGQRVRCFTRNGHRGICKSFGRRRSNLCGVMTKIFRGAPCSFRKKCR
jgi:hypothetical protein